MIGYLCGGMISVKKNSRELMNSIMTSDEASEESEFLSALNASLQSFVHKTLKDEKKNAFIESHSMGEMFCRCYRRD